jgi:hypothetical protein
MSVDQIPMHCVQAHERIASLETKVEAVGQSLNKNTDTLGELKEVILEERVSRKARYRITNAVIAMFSGIIGYFIKS